MIIFSFPSCHQLTRSKNYNLYFTQYFLELAQNMLRLKVIFFWSQVVSDRCASVPIRQEWVTFLIKKSLIGRNGWKIMTENEEMNLRLNRETIEMVTEKIRWGDAFDICFFDKKTFRAWCTFIGHINQNVSSS